MIKRNAEKMEEKGFTLEGRRKKERGLEIERKKVAKRLETGERDTGRMIKGKEEEYKRKRKCIGWQEEEREWAENRKKEGR